MSSREKPGGRDVPNIYIGTNVKKRDRLAFKQFVTEVITDTFINAFTPTSSSLDGELFTVFLGPVDNTPGGDDDFTDDVYEVSGSSTVSGSTGTFNQPVADIEGYRFLYEDLQVDSVEDYIDIYLFGVRQPADRYEIELYKYPSGSILPPEKLEGTTVGTQEIRFVFKESITRVPEDVVITDWDIKGKIKEITTDSP